MEDFNEEVHVYFLEKARVCYRAGNALSNESIVEKYLQHAAKLFALQQEKRQADLRNHDEAAETDYRTRNFSDWQSCHESALRSDYCIDGDDVTRTPIMSFNYA